MDRLKDGLDGEHTTVTVMLQKEVDKYQVPCVCIVAKCNVSMCMSACKCVLQLHSHELTMCVHCLSDLIATIANDEIRKG